MNILLTGANGYIGSRLLPILVEHGHHVFALVRNPERFFIPENIKESVTPIQGDLLESHSLASIPKDINAAYYLVHSMSKDAKTFDVKDRKAAENFKKGIEATQCKQVIYLTGLVNDEKLSKHLQSRYEVEKILKTSSIPTTVLRAGIIIGSGSASYEIIRDLVEKLPIMIAPKWVNSQCQPIAIFDVIDYLQKVLGHKNCIGKTFDIGSDDVLTYKEMLYTFARLRGLKRFIISVPLFTPKLSSYWLFFVTSTSFDLARTLVASMTSRSTCKNFEIKEILDKKCISYEESLKRCFSRIEEHAVISSWKDSFSASRLAPKYGDYIHIPEFGCLHSIERFYFEGDPNQVMDAIFSMGGKQGYYMNWAWRIRGLADRLIGGVGLRRGKTYRKRPRPGDALDFWRVLFADEEHRRFLLFAEMKVPGEAWLEFKIEKMNEGYVLIQTATFRPKGVFGRIYWMAMYPVHLFLFAGFGKKFIMKAKEVKKVHRLKGKT